MIHLDPAVACEECGRFGAYALGARHLCVDCYQSRAACCAEAEMPQGGDEGPSAPGQAEKPGELPGS